MSARTITTYILLLDLSLLFRCEVIDDVKQLPDLLGCLALDHVGDGLTSNVTVGNSSSSTSLWNGEGEKSEIIDKTPLPRKPCKTYSSALISK